MKSINRKIDSWLINLQTVLLVFNITAGSGVTFLGPTFGSGLAGVQICPGNTVILNHSLGADANNGVLHHFWTTGAISSIDRIHVEYYVDGELTPSISFQPALMCGVGFPKYYNSSREYSAGELCGKSAPVGGWWNTFPIPFQKSIVVTARPDPADSSECINGYLNVRGTENLPVMLPGGLTLPSSARLILQKNEWATRQPYEFVNVISLPAHQNGLIFMSSLFVEARPVGGSKAGGGYIEGCWNLINGANSSYPGLVVGTGVEDYFDSAYYFGADSPGHKAQEFISPLSGLPFFSRTSDGYERLSAYRFHNLDPLIVNNGGSLTWRVGAKPGPGNSKCGCNLPPIPPSPTPTPAPAPEPGPPSTVGCADGQCDALCNHSSVRGCFANWAKPLSMRAPKTGNKCGDRAGYCDAPADACADGWEPCLSNASSGSQFSVDDFRNVISVDDCNNAHLTAAFLGAMSHADPKFENLPPKSCPPNVGTIDNGCHDSNWGCEPVCCGRGCVEPSCPDEVCD